MDGSDGKLLLKLARKSIESVFSKEKIDLKKYSKFDKEQGVFVTLNKHGELRGCIGFPYPTKDLYMAVFDAARAAAFEDPRFPALTEDEIKEIDIEVSVLTIPEKIDCTPEEYVNHIDIGKDGLILKSPLSSGLLLPQVFTEYKASPKKALEMTCQKAGLPVDAWKDSSIKILKFQAEIFREDSA